MDHIYEVNGPGVIEKDILVLEIAIGLDRCVYCYNQRIKENSNGTASL